MTADDSFWDNIFHGCAWAAYLEILAATRQFPPDSEATRRLAYQYYEQELAENNRRKQPAVSSRTPRREAGQDCEAPQGGGEPEPSVVGKSDLRPEATVKN